MSAKPVSIIDASSHNLTTTDAIATLETEMLDMPQADCPVTHHFGPGIYIREVRIQAGIFSVGHHQNYEHLNIMVKGRVLMLADDGTIQEVKAPFM